MGQRGLTLLGLALLFTLLNAAKPLTIDDTAYHYFASQSAADPLHPYGFRFIWYYTTQDANDILAPPVLPAWWGLGMRLLGDSPVLWKLWLFPFAVAFVFALHALARRFCRGLELPLVVLIVFSPQVLPAFNLMLDVPAQALGLSAVALFLRAMDRRSLGLTVATALLAGVATETKYTAFLIPPLLVWAALLRGRFGAALVAAVVPALVFVAVEYGIAHQHGHSHFLRQIESMQQAPDPWDKKLGLFGPLAGYLGGLAAGVFLLGIAGLTRRTWAVAAAAALVVGGLVLVARLPLALDPDTHEADFTAESVYVGTVFAVLLLTTVAVVVRVLNRDWRHWPRLRADLLLLGWWLIELLGYFPLTPFGAARRCMGLTIVLTLLAGRWAARTCRTPRRRRAVWLAAGVSAALGGLYAGLDAYEADVHRRAAQEAATVAREASPGGQVWYVGHWGFQFYAERAGMRPVDPGTTVLRAGDTLVVPHPDCVHSQTLNLTGAPVERVAELSWQDRFPLSTLPTYYGGHKPIERRVFPRMLLTVYRVQADFLTTP